MAIAENKKKNTIKITVSAKGDFTYENPLIWVCPGDTIIWECKNSCPFAIHLGWNSPLEKGRYRSKDGTIIEAKVKEEPQFGYYHYIVAVFDEETRELWIDDPPFIVKPPPEG